jgi:hypothetical protein
MSINYSNTKIYKIYSQLGDKIYIGATTKSLNGTMSSYRNSYYVWKSKYIVLNSTSANLIFETYGLNNCKIALIIAQPCKNKEEFCKLKCEYVRQLICVNMLIPRRTSKEYFKDNVERLNERITCECGGCYSFKRKAAHIRTKAHQKYLNSHFSDLH